MTQKRVLIISYYWPPSGGVGVQRWLHFARNLKIQGWEPLIYTPSNPQFDVHDESLQQFVADIEVLKQPIWEPFTVFHRLTGGKNKSEVKQGLVMEKSKKSWKDKLIVWIRGNLFVPDPRVFWVKPSVRYLLPVLRERGIDTIITTGPPHSMHLIGLGLKNQIPGLKWVADFRDPWSDWDVIRKLNASEWILEQHRKMERTVLQHADRVITVSRRLGEALAAKSGVAKEVQVIPNGISDERMIPLQQSSVSDERFVMGYYGMLNELRNPEQLWNILERICEENKGFSDKLEIRLGGIVAQSIMDRIQSSRVLKDKVHLLGYLSHEETYREYDRCNLLLLLLNQSDNAQWILPMKFFEYLSAGKPILSLGSVESELAEKFEHRQIGVMVDFSQSEAIEDFIMANFDGNYSVSLSDHQELLHEYTRSNQARVLNEVLLGI